MIAAAAAATNTMTTMMTTTMTTTTKITTKTVEAYFDSGSDCVDDRSCDGVETCHPEQQ